MRVKAALLAFGIFEAVELDRALPDANRAEAADPPRIAQQFALDREALLAVLVDRKPRPALVERGIDVFVPEIERRRETLAADDGAEPYNVFTPSRYMRWLVLTQPVHAAVMCARKVEPAIVWQSV